MYEELRKYILEYDAVETLAELEILVYSAFPDIKQVRKYFEALCKDINSSGISKEDDELCKAVDSFRSYVEHKEEFYSRLNSVREVIQK